MCEITATGKRATEKTLRGNGQQKIGQPDNSATKNDSVGKRATQSYIVSRRDGNSCLANRKKMAFRKWAFIYVMLSHG